MELLTPPGAIPASAPMVGRAYQAITSLAQVSKQFATLINATFYEKSVCCITIRDPRVTVLGQDYGWSILGTKSSSTVKGEQFILDLHRLAGLKRFTRFSVNINTGYLCTGGLTALQHVMSALAPVSANASSPRPHSIGVKLHVESTGHTHAIMKTFAPARKVLALVKQYDIDVEWSVCLKIYEHHTFYMNVIQLSRSQPWAESPLKATARMTSKRSEILAEVQAVRFLTWAKMSPRAIAKRSQRWRESQRLLSMVRDLVDAEYIDIKPGGFLVRLMFAAEAALESKNSVRMEMLLKVTGAVWNQAISAYQEIMDATRARSGSEVNNLKIERLPCPPIQQDANRQTDLSALEMQLENVVDLINKPWSSRTLSSRYRDIEQEIREAVGSVHCRRFSQIWRC
jgi:hypothetical protein